MLTWENRKIVSQHQYEWINKVKIKGNTSIKLHIKFKYEIEDIASKKWGGRSGMSGLCKYIKEWHHDGILNLCSYSLIKIVTKSRSYIYKFRTLASLFLSIWILGAIIYNPLNAFLTSHGQALRKYAYVLSLLTKGKIELLASNLFGKLVLLAWLGWI